MNPNDQSQVQERCPEIIDEDNQEALLDYENKAEVTANGKYRCRDCGAVFDTLEAHDKHHRAMHSRAEAYLNQGMTM